MAKKYLVTRNELIHLSYVSPNTILQKLKQVDGAGSGLDADTVDGLHARQFVRSDAGSTLHGVYDLSSATLRWYRDSDYAEISIADYGQNRDWLTILFGDDPGEDRIRFRWHGTDGTYNVLDILSNRVNFYKQPFVSGHVVWHSGNDGSGSGLDADTVDGKHASQIIQEAINHLSVIDGGNAYG